MLILVGWRVIRITDARSKYMSALETPTGPRAPTLGRKILRSGCLAVSIVILALGLLWLWVYGLDSHHTNRNSIGPGRIYSLTPPTATDITLQKDFLDHYATYIVVEKDLNAFLDKRFAEQGEELNSFEDRRKPRANQIGVSIGPFGWVVTENMVVYRYTASNGGGHAYYHDPTTGWTYQDSAHW